jgi:3-oxoacyl-[acyl-carrier-protein] synthase II
MTNPLVIVGIAHIDAGTENVVATKTEQDIWMFSVPQDATELAQQAVIQLAPHVREHVRTVITCNTAGDTYARQRCISLGHRFRPKDVLGILGVNLVTTLNAQLPNMQNIFNAEAACASGIVGLELADMIARINNTIVLVTGVEKATSPFSITLFRSINALSNSTNQYYVPFDAQRHGFAMGEGAGVIAVATLSHAQELNLPIIATINSVSIKSIVTHPTQPSDPANLERFIRDAIQKSGKELSDFAYWDAHATATPAGDEAEYKLFSNIFSEHDLAISSFKSRIGHCLGASSLIEIINGIEQLQQQTITHNHNLTDKFVNDDRIITQPVQTTKLTFIKTSFGFGGRNGVAVITVH